MDCASCIAGLDHCHGTLVVHPEGGFADCTAGECADHDLLRHALIVGCASFGRGCSCVVTEEMALRQAS